MTLTAEQLYNIGQQQMELDTGTAVEGSALSEKTAEDVSLIKDIGMSAASGIYNSIRSSQELLGQLVYYGMTGEEYEGDIMQDNSFAKVPKYDYESKTLTGSVVDVVSQVGGGLAMGGPAFKAVGAGVKGVSTITKFAKNAKGQKIMKGLAPVLKGMFVDGVAFDEDEANLSNFLVSTDSEVAQYIGDFLNHEDDDGFFEKRLKNTLEGALLGGAVDLTMNGLRYMKDGIKSKVNLEGLKKELSSIKTTSEKTTAFFEKNLKGVKIEPVAVKEVAQDEVAEVLEEVRRQPIPRKAKPTTLEAIKERVAEKGLKITDDMTDKEAEDIMKIALKTGDLPLTTDVFVSEVGREYRNVQKVYKEKVMPLIESGNLNRTDQANLLQDTLFPVLKAIGNVKDYLAEPATAMKVASADKDYVALNNYFMKYLVENASVMDTAKITKELLESDVKDIPKFIEQLTKNIDNYKTEGGLWNNLMYIRSNLMLGQASTFVRDTITTPALFALNRLETAAGGAFGWARNALDVKITKDTGMTVKTAMYLKNKFLGKASEDRIFAEEALQGWGVYGNTIAQSMTKMFRDLPQTNTGKFMDKFSLIKGDAYMIPGNRLTPETFGVKKGTDLYSAFKWLDKISPINLMQKKDDVLQAATYYAQAQQRAYRYVKQQALQNPELDVAKLQKDILNKVENVDFDNPPKEIFGDDAVAYSIANRSFSESQEMTFRNELTGTSKKVYDVMNSRMLKPFFDLVVPFKKTPIVIQFERFIGDRTILPLFSSQTRMRQALAKGGAEADMVRGRLAVSSTLMATAVALHQNGRLTGDFYRDDARDVLLANGVQPNSLKVGDKWYDIARFSPVSSFFTTMANVAQIVDNYGEELDDESKEELNALQMTTAMGLSAILATFEASIQGSYVESLRDFFTMVGQQDAASADRFLMNLVPAPGLPGEVVMARESLLEGQDPLYDEINSYKQYAMNSLERIMVRSGINTRPQLDLFGEKIKESEHWLGFIPMTHNEQSTDILLAEMLRTNAFVDSPNRNAKLVEKVVLTKEQVYRWKEIMGSMKVQDKMRKFVKSKMYEALPNTQTYGGKSKNTKRGMLVNLYNEFKKQAYYQLLKEDKELQTKINNVRIQKETKEIEPKFKINSNVPSFNQGG